MKLGTQTNSLVNHIHSRALLGQPEPTVGMGATLLSWTDRHAATIVSVERLDKSKRFSFLVGVQEDHAKRIDKNGMSESQEYEFTPRPDAPFILFALWRDGAGWMAVKKNERGMIVKASTRGLCIGKRDHYHDFSF